jgi:hypothetical protein
MASPAPEAPVEEPKPDAPVVPETPVEETVTLPKAQADALRRELAEEQRARKRLEDAQKKAKEEQAAEQGKWQELAEQREKDLAAERSQREASERNSRITTLATRAKFIDPADVIGRVKPEDATDDAAITAALERIAEQSPHLVAKEAPAVPQIGEVLTPSAPGAPKGDGRPQPPPGKAPLTSLDEANALPVSEAVARMPEIEWLERQQK